MKCGKGVYFVSAGLSQKKTVTSALFSRKEQQLSQVDLFSFCFVCLFSFVVDFLYIKEVELTDEEEAIKANLMDSEALPPEVLDNIVLDWWNKEPFR